MVATERKALVLLLILCFVMVSFQEIWTVKAENIIFIRSSGVVEGTDKISRQGNVYTFTDNIYDSIIVERDNVVLDGAGYMLQGNGTEYGVKLEGSGVTVNNMKISNFVYGIYLYRSDNNVISANIVTENSYGIHVPGPENNTITDNIVANNGDGLYLSGINNVLRNNQMTNNTCNFGVLPQPHYNDVDTSNTVNGKPIYYWVDQHNKTVPLDAGCVILKNCTNITVQNLSLDNNKEGATLIYTTDAVVKNCSMSYNKSGIRISHCSNVNVTQNSLTNNYGDGATVWDSTNILVDQNQIQNNGEIGVELFGSRDSNTVSGNTVTGSEVGIELRANSRNNTVCGNTITECSQGILISTSPYITLRDNSLLGNEQHFSIEHDHYGNASLEVPYLIHDIDSSNTVDTKPMYYWIGQQNRAVPSDAGYVGLVNCTNMTVSNLVENVSGILLAFTNDSLITQNRIKNTAFGIKLWRGTNNTITENHLADNDVGVTLRSSAGNIVCSNTVTGNGRGIEISGDSGNYICKNTISNNNCGVYLDWANNNSIYTNNFIDNTRHVQDTTDITVPTFIPFPTSIHNWNSNYPLGGNYWSGYTGVDKKSGPDQNMTGSDGIIDAPLSLYTNNTDRYPIVAPISFLDAGTWEGTHYYVDVVSDYAVTDLFFNPSEETSVSFDVEETGDASGFFRVTMPKTFLWTQNSWNIKINDQSVEYTIDEDDANTYLYFTSDHSAATVKIIGTHAIPEFTSLSAIVFIAVVLAAVLIAYKQKLFFSH